ncbi:MAG: hypothetical protein HY774_07950 [Acidobacteria bacterium]|nr:hypothetical protein [Acidobacteriota bacterium]
MHRFDHDTSWYGKAPTSRRTPNFERTGYVSKMGKVRDLDWDFASISTNIWIMDATANNVECCPGAITCHFQGVPDAAGLLEL